MSYLVLARKWRPKRFAELVGQEHVVRALTNALETGRVHHAFLFTGTRGVGKTTIARIFAKSLNCERGTSADPCGECETCLAIDAGRYIDLLEIDAASNTGVDDVREVIENAQYMPSRGKFKVYLIDEVHMLSKAAFNALLKTLEEPPEHVKFLLATTDPQKLPVTVLSRCLQFNLKRLDEGQISGQIDKILKAEQIDADAGAIRQIAKAADGSLRDGLSLLDQAIAYSGCGVDGGKLDDATVAAMLGTVDRTQVGAMLDALADGNGAKLLETVAKLADFSPDWAAVLDALAEALHRIQVKQLVPEVAVEAECIDAAAFAARLRPEVVQLWYQMALAGRRDLPSAPSARAGFEMSVLRMLAFRPAQAGDAAPGGMQAGEGARATASAGASSMAAAAPVMAESSSLAAEPAAAPVSPDAGRGGKANNSERVVEVQPPVAAAAPKPEHEVRETRAAYPAGNDIPIAPVAQPHARLIGDAEEWLALVASCNLRGPSKELAANTAFIGHADGVLKLSLPAGFDYLRSQKSLADLSAALAAVLGAAPQIVFEDGTASAPTLNERDQRERGQRQSAAEEDFVNHPDVRLLMAQGAKLVPDSIRPLDN
ncbi:MAG: DNA polymerase III subunit gamma/tau [Pseudoxanthomonas sp.]